MTAGEVLHPLGAHADDNLVAGLDLGISTGFGDDWLRLGAVKIFADGSLVGKTAAMHDPFAGNRDNRGYLQADADVLRAGISPRTAPAGRSPRTRSATGPSTWCSTPTPTRWRSTRGGTRGTASSTSPWSSPGRSPGPRTRRDRRAAGPLRHRARRRHARRGRPGPARLAVPAAVPARGGHGAAGQLGPAGGGRGAAARHRRHGEPAHLPGAPFNPGEAVTAEQALRAWTWGSAYASRQEHVKGSIAPGMLADLVVLSEDPTAVSPDRLAALEVLATIVDGQFGYGSLD